MSDLPSRLAPRLSSALLVLALGCRESTGPVSLPEMEPSGNASTAVTIAFRQVTAGNSSTCAIDQANQAYCWGAGALGAGPTTFSPTPIPVLGGQAFRQVSAGWGHACGVTVGGALFCWGSNRSGELGDGTGSDRLRPVRIARELRFLQVSAGQLHTCAVAVDHAAYCWGHNQAGPLGNGTSSSDPSLLPVRVVGNLTFREVSAGNQFTCGVTTGDVAYCWGLNNTGQLGVGPNGGPESCFTGDGFNFCSTKPVRVRRGLAFRRVDAGESHACGVTTDGNAYCWGASFAGQLGRGTSSGFEVRPVPVAGGLNFAGLGVGELHACGATTDGVTWCWGGNSDGQLGNGSNSGPDTCPEISSSCGTRPVRVSGDIVFTQVAAGGHHSCGLTANGRIFCWGNNDGGQLGDGTTRSRTRPRRVVTGG